MRITLNIFSGRQNPNWLLSNDEVRQLTARIAGQPSPMGEPAPYTLGFRGFEVVADPGDQPWWSAGLPNHCTLKPSMARAAEGMEETILASQSNVIQQEDDTCLWLLTSTARDAIDDNLRDYVVSCIRSTESTSRVTTAPPAETPPESFKADISSPECAPFVTPFYPQFWNHPAVRLGNNCYNFATNYRTNTLAQPGRYTGQIYSDFDCDAISDAATSDGCLRQCEGTNRLLALAIWPGLDFHWWRFTSSGYWAHKVGIAPATNLDASRRIITGANSPINADRGPYTLFCGYRYAPLSVRVL